MTRERIVRILGLLVLLATVVLAIAAILHEVGA
jgi:hypothetical protein